MSAHRQALSRPLAALLAAFGLGSGVLLGPVPYLAAVPAARAAATTFTVTVGADLGDAVPGDGLCEAEGGGGQCSIRAAIQEANAKPEAAPYRILLPAGTYTLSIAGDSENDAASGDVDIRVPVELLGAGAEATIIHGHGENLDHAFEVFPPALVRVAGLTIRDGTGGGLQNRGGQLEVAGCVISNNRANFGGGIANDGVLTVTNSVIAQNKGAQGGGIVSYGGSQATIVGSRIEGNGDSQGGGLLIHGALLMEDSAVLDNLGSQGAGLQLHGDLPIVIRNSLVAHNHASSHPEPPWHGYGGGILNQATQVYLENVTLSDNWGQGGGILNQGQITLTYSTLSTNGTDSWGGTISNLGSLWIGSSILGPAQGGNCDSSRNALISLGHNLDRDGTCMLRLDSDRQAVDPLLGPLADNGGATFTHALLVSSPAIDAGDPERCPPTDQRTAPRPAGAGCDIGAFEYGATVGAPTPTRPTPTATPSATEAPPSPTATSTATGTQPTPQPSATETATPGITPVADIRMSGLVYDAPDGKTHPIQAAAVTFEPCVPRQPFRSYTNAEGRYTLLLPGPYIESCGREVLITVRAGDYIDLDMRFLVNDLRLRPERDFALDRLAVPTVPTPTATEMTTPTATSSPTPTRTASATRTPTATPTRRPTVTPGRPVYLPLAARGSAFR